MRSDWYRKIFETRLSKSRSRATDFVTTAGGGVYATSIGAGITGWGGDYIFIDDPLEQKDAANIEKIDGVNHRFDNTIMNRLNDPKNGCVIVVAHRLHEDDLSGHVLKGSGGAHLSLPFRATRTRKYMIGDEIWKRRKDELLRPAAFSRKDVERICNTSNYESLYQQNPRGAGLPRITAEMFLKFAPEPSILQPVVISIDPGQEHGEANSQSVIQAWVVHQAGYLLQDQYRGRPSYSDLRETLRALVRRYRPSAVLIEKAGLGTALLDDIRYPSWTEVVPVTAQDNKAERLRKVIDLIKDQRVWVSTESWRMSTSPSSSLFQIRNSRTRSTRPPSS